MRRFSNCLFATVLLLLSPNGRAGSTNSAHLSDQANAENREPCLAAGSENAAPLVMAERRKISRGAASYVIRHVRNVCSILVSASRPGSPLEPISPSLTPVLNDLHSQVLSPIFRSHPDLKTASLRDPSKAQAGKSAKQRTAKKVYRATKKDISRQTATWLIRELLQIQQAILKASSDFVAAQTDKKLEETASEAVLDAAAELSAAMKVVGDAYRDVWMKEVSAGAPHQKRTAESDTEFRKIAMPHGSV